jgi:hypothetical protein
MDMPIGNQKNIGLTILGRPENASEPIIMNWEQNEGRNGILMCCEKGHELKPGFYESTEWDSKAWEQVRLLLRDRLRRRFRFSSMSLKSLFVHRTLPDVEDCSLSQASLKFPTYDKDREIYAICERVVALLVPYGELMAQDLKVHPYQGRLIPWKSIEVVSTELRNLYHALREAYRLERSIAETEPSDLFIEDMAVKLAGEVKRAVFEIGFYSYPSNSLPPTSPPS